MSTEIKNTLFRFVTMRAPELLEKKDVDIRFIQHPDLNSSASPFLTAIRQIPAGKTKKQILDAATTTYASSALNTREDVRALLTANLYDFAIWLTANRSTLTVESVTPYLTTPALANNTLRLKLWDNLFYQILTYRSGYVREAVISILAADFFLANISKVAKNKKSYRKLAQARAVIPNELFGLLLLPEATTLRKDALDKLPLSTKHLDKEMNTALAAHRITEYEKALNELVSAKALHDKTIAKVYQSELENYNSQIKEAYAKAGIEEQTYIDPELKVNKRYREYTDLSLPEFNFKPSAELEPVNYEKVVSEETRNLVEKIKETKGIETFSEAIDAVNVAIQDDYHVVFEGSNLKRRNLNGAVGGSSNPQSGGTRGSSSGIAASGYYNGTPTISTEPVFTISSTGITTSRKSALLMIMDNVPAGIDVIDATYSATTNFGTTFTRTANFTNNWINGKLHVTIFTDKIDTNTPSSLTLTGELTLSNGDKITFTGSCSILYEWIPALSSSERSYKGNGRFTYVPFKLTDNNGNEIADSQPILEYKPSGFGIKRLGIADYRKVEQEVCCYVPGEVSHIENIMAREYKERATRRLTRSEDTTTTSSEQEQEKLTDTSTTNRFEMNKEIASIIAEDKSIGAHTAFSASWGNDTTGRYGINAGADFATTTSKEQSDIQAVTQAKEITERALERVVTKVKEERIIKVIEEFEETNKHGFDNRAGDTHISGVFRWVDKIYRNKVVNYGKRLMYEFMVPEPAAFHNEALSGTVADIEYPIKPLDPREGDGVVQIKTHKDINATNYLHWAAVYNADVQAKPDTEIVVGKSFSVEPNTNNNETFSKNDKVDLPEGYIASSAKTVFAAHHDNDNGQSHNISIVFGDASNSIATMLRGVNALGTFFQPIAAFKKEVPVSMTYYNFHTGAVNVTVKARLSPEAEEQWKIDTFNAIISAYENQLAQYNKKMDELRSMVQEKVRLNPMFYRQIENMALRKNCISYMADHANMGKDMMEGRNTMGVRAKYNQPELEKYAAFVKFFEQAFEWDLMSYYFYPLYWADKEQWKDLYNIDNDNALFRSFLQSGMARVILTVRPGFEEAVNWYMATGQIWNGGQVPTLNDPLFLSIVQELMETEGTVEDTWESRVPTSLTVIQAGTVGLEVQGLPCDADCDEYKLFDSDGMVTGTVPNPIVQTNQLMEAPQEQTP